MVRFTPLFAGRSTISPSLATCGIWFPSSQNTWPWIPCPSFLAVLQESATVTRIVKTTIALKALITFWVDICIGVGEDLRSEERRVGKEGRCTVAECGE